MTPTELSIKAGFSSDEIADISRWICDAEAEAHRYYSTVHALWGPVIAEQSTLDWVCEIESMAWPPDGPGSWREISVKVLQRMLAKQANHSFAQTAINGDFHDQFNQ